MDNQHTDRLVQRAFNWRETDKALILAKKQASEVSKAKDAHELAIRKLRDAVDAVNTGTPP